MAAYHWRMGISSASATAELTASMKREQEAGMRFAHRAKLAVLTAIAIYLLAIVPLPRVLWPLGFLLLFALTSVAPTLLGRDVDGQVAWTWRLMPIEVALLVFLLISPNPLHMVDWPVQTGMRFQNFLYLGLYVAGSALSYSPRYVLVTGVVAAALWGAGVGIVYNLSDTVRAPADAQFGSPELLAAILDPHFVSLGNLMNQVVLLLLTAGTIAVAMHRARQLVVRTVQAEVERTNLARYFPPEVATHLSRGRRRFDHATTQPVAVLFADIVGYTSLAERLPPVEVLAMLRQFHGRVSEAAFAHGGTVEKYIGDAVKISFGLPMPADDDATRAVTCALAICAEFDDWNRVRAASGEAALGLGIGVHWGEAAVGDLGDGRALEFTVIGDTVNVAARLEQLTRELGARIVLSEDCWRRLETEGRLPASERAAFTAAEPRVIRGRAAPLAIRWR
jgi:adenylate cyclase